MIQIRVEVRENKSGRVSIESKIAVCKNTPLTKGEAKVSNKIKNMIESMMVELSKELPDAILALSEEDVETLKGMERLNLKKENDDDKETK